MLQCSATAEVAVKPTRRTATISTQGQEKDAKKNEKIIELIKKKCKDNDIKINGSKSNMAHEIKEGSFWSPGSKEVANLFWSCHVEGSNKNIGNVCAELFKELGEDAPKVDFHEEDVTEEEFTKAEEEAVELASQKAKRKAEITAKVFGATIVKLQVLNVNSHKTFANSMEAAFACADMSQQQQSFGLAGGFAKRAPAPPAQLVGQRITKASATVNCTYVIE